MGEVKSRTGSTQPPSPIVPLLPIVALGCGWHSRTRLSTAPRLMVCQLMLNSPITQDICTGIQATDTKSALPLWRQCPCDTDPRRSVTHDQAQPPSLPRLSARHFLWPIYKSQLSAVIRRVVPTPSHSIQEWYRPGAPSLLLTTFGLFPLSGALESCIPGKLVSLVLRYFGIGSQESLHEDTTSNAIR